ncbi:MAG TPA: hypothetical protein PLO51_03270 [Candidatus Micrarchaeota archaeon]|nr:hypothetical protein [Candidatus Micrarchaeota archaeon]
MDFKSVLAGVFLAFGASNLLAVFGISFSLLSIGSLVFFGVDFGKIIAAVLSIAIAYYLIKAKD